MQREHLRFEAVDLAGEPPHQGGKGVQGRADVNGQIVLLLVKRFQQRGHAPRGEPVVTPYSARWAQSALMSIVRWRTIRPRLSCSNTIACCSTAFAATNRIVGRVIASQIASASVACGRAAVMSARATPCLVISDSPGLRGAEEDTKLTSYTVLARCQDAGGEWH